MGDLRNKIAKQMAAERHTAYLKKLYPPKPPPPPIQCRCGYTTNDREIWSVPVSPWRSIFACSDCWPDGVARP